MKNTLFENLKINLSDFESGKINIYEANHYLWDNLQSTRFRAVADSYEEGEDLPFTADELKKTYTDIIEEITEDRTEEEEKAYNDYWEEWEV